MKLVTLETINRTTYAGVLRGERVLPLNYPTLLELLQDPEGMARARQVLESNEGRRIRINTVESHCTVPVLGVPTSILDAGSVLLGS